jgi:hypothetical protein
VLRAELRERPSFLCIMLTDWFLYFDVLTESLYTKTLVNFRFSTTKDLRMPAPVAAWAKSEVCGLSPVLR